MANGKGALDCHYCRYDHGGRCEFHEVELPTPSSLGNIVCGNFEPAELYWRDNNLLMPPARRFGWFGHDLKPGVLYEFQYNAPETLRELATLRKPDYQSGGWKT